MFFDDPIDEVSFVYRFLTLITGQWIILLTVRSCLSICVEVSLVKSFVSIEIFDSIIFPNGSFVFVKTIDVWKFLKHDIILHWASTKWGFKSYLCGISSDLLYVAGSYRVIDSSFHRVAWSVNFVLRPHGDWRGIGFGNFEVWFFPSLVHPVSLPFYRLRLHCNLDITRQWQGSCAIFFGISSDLSYVMCRSCGYTVMALTKWGFSLVYGISSDYLSGLGFARFAFYYSLLSVLVAIGYKALNYSFHGVAVRWVLQSHNSSFMERHDLEIPKFGFSVCPFLVHPVSLIFWSLHCNLDITRHCQGSYAILFGTALSISPSTGKGSYAISYGISSDLPYMSWFRSLHFNCSFLLVLVVVGSFKIRKVFL
ncbi:hypothetical protein MTR67_001634 [Solanum verrucosum]|uniref:Uncharacterized protein n=1 Tax=Solanum verrucosum TaxID=315347 RepID=A0AAF0PNL5_SOLVR|nr:hypothetical protein MTR67_001634 [Solanum verrucosum]